MQRAEITARLADVAGAAHDREPEQTAPRRDGLPDHHRCQPEEQRRERKPVAQQLRSRKPEAVGELAEHAQRAKANRGTDDERHAHGVSIGRGRWHPAIVWTKALLDDDRRIGERDRVVGFLDRRVADEVRGIGQDLAVPLASPTAAQKGVVFGSQDGAVDTYTPTTLDEDAVTPDSNLERAAVANTACGAQLGWIGEVPGRRWIRMVGIDIDRDGVIFLG